MSVGKRLGRPPLADRDEVKSTKKRVTMYYGREDVTKRMIDFIMQTKRDNSLSSMLGRLVREEYERALSLRQKEREILGDMDSREK